VDELEGFLSAQRDKGELDSDGEFTISVENARLKLRKYQLSHPVFYLLKIFQSAVKANPFYIRIELSGRTVRLWFETQHSVYDIPKMISALDTVLAPAEVGLRHLVIGINSSMAIEPEYVMWGEWAEQARAVKITKDGVQMVQNPKPPVKGFPHIGGASYLFELKKRGSFLRSEVAIEEAMVKTRCCYAPAKVILNGRELSNRWDSAHTSPRLNELTEPFFLTERFVLDPRGRFEQGSVDLREYDEEGELWLRKGRAKKSFCLQFLGPIGQVVRPEVDRPLRCSAEYAVPVALTGESKIYVVKDGVVLNPVRLSDRKDQFTQMGALAVIQGDDVEVDVSEFSVVEDRAFQEFVDEAYHNWGEMVATVLPRLDRLKRCPAEPEHEERGERRRQSVAGASGGCLLPFLIGLVVPDLMAGGVYTSVGALAMLGGALFPYRKQPADRDQQLREYVQEHLPGST
jgi:hypothetical protein